MGIDLIIVRHGRTAWNQEVRFRGRTDLPLDEVGLRQAQAAARAVRSRWPAVAALYTSPLQRARQTAGPIAEALGLAAQPREELLDVDYGEWTGLSPAEAQERDPERYRLWRTAPQELQFPQGESLLQVQSRLQALLEHLLQEYAGRTVVLVGHLVVNRVLLCTLLGLDLGYFWRLGQDPAALNQVHYENGNGRLLLLNDTCHLREAGLLGGTDGGEEKALYPGRR
ncbi:MAG: histidine phosphatase family protein [Chloroflexia bacterium]